MKAQRFYYMLLLFGVALLLRLIAVGVLGEPGNPEMYEHGAIAHNLYAGYGFAMHWPYLPHDSHRQELLQKLPQYEGAWQPPLNPYLIYAAFSLFGETPIAALALMLCNALFSAAIPLLVYRLALFIRSEKEARVSGVVALFFFPAIVGVTSYSGSSLYQLVLLVTLYFFGLIVQSGKTWHFILAGISSGVLTLLRSEFIFLGFILQGVAGFLLWRKFCSRLYLYAALVGVLAFISVVAPWTYRNYMLFGRLIPVVSRSAHELWRGNNLYATGSPFTADGKEIWLGYDMFPNLVQKMDALPYNQHLEVAMDSVFRHEVIQYVAEHPIRSALLAGKKVLMLWTFDPYYPPARHPLYIVSMLMVTIPSGVGFWRFIQRCKREGDFSIALLFAVYIGFYTATFAATFVLPRYQIYFFTGILPFTGIGWLALIKMITDRKGILPQ